MAKKNSAFSAPGAAVDPALDALFSTSSGPVTGAPRSRYPQLLLAADADGPNEVSEEISNEDEDDESGDDLAALYKGEIPAADLSDTDGSEDDAPAKPTDKRDRKRKRRQRDEDDGLEARHLRKLAKDDGRPEKKRRGDETEAAAVESESDVSLEHAPVHESVSADPEAAERERTLRTAFLSNVSADAIASRKAKKTLLAHLSSVLDGSASPPQRIESLRFRSTAFATAAIPKRAAFITKALMASTTKSTNAYVVFSDASAVAAAVSRLNGSVVLDRHLRVDSAASPAPVDHRRCVFVGNLGFVDDESMLGAKADDEGNEVAEKRKRSKTPMDVEEGLWRVFGKHAGKVESVRVVRDPATRVGKGFAYVQFYNENHVEAALLLAGKTFAPLLPRALRVNRCKAPHKTARAMEAKTGKAAGPDDKRHTRKPITGRRAALTGVRRNRGDHKTDRDNADHDNTKHVVFEGRRASARDGKPKDLKFKGSKGQKKKSPKEGRGAVRAAKWRAQGGSKE